MNNDDYLDQPNSPTRQPQIKPEYEYFISIAGRYDDLDEAIKDATKYAFDDIGNDCIELITVKKHYKDGDYIDTVFEISAPMLSMQIAKLTIELFQLESVQWSKNSDEQVRINEIKKEINNFML